jgi:peptidoglycan hydrolase-like protein with peptidoglycan-binding domain
MRSAGRRLAVFGVAGVVAASLVSQGTAAVGATVSAEAPAAVGVRSLSSGYVPSPRIIKLGMRGADVKRLQERLAQLSYYPGKIDSVFGLATLAAVWAFQEVQGIRPVNNVSRLTERALVHPRAPRALVPHGGALRVEVDLRHQLLYVYHRNEVVLTSHISSGGGYYYCSQGSCSRAITPAGNFHITRRIKGWHRSALGLMYNPVYFTGGYAIHGDTDVPLQPVSHGCVRIPMDVAVIFPGLVPANGIPVYIRR